MKNLLTIIAILALFLVSCSKGSDSAASGEISEKAISTVVKSDGGEVENEGQAAEGEEADDEGDIDQKEEGEEEQEPTPEELIAAFVATHFPEAAIAASEEDEEEEGLSIKLDDGTHIVFDENFDWKKVDCKHSTIYTAVPESIVPEAITAYVVENYPDNTIMDIKKVGFGFMVRLNNKTKIKFDSDFNIR
jgi:hypothetical protein